jgi:hypothetical protein
MTALKIIFLSLAAATCFGYALWQKCKRPANDGCIYKPPGFHKQHHSKTISRPAPVRGAYKDSCHETFTPTFTPNNGK